VALVRIDASEKNIASVIMAAVLFTLMMEGICSSETPALTRATRRHIEENTTFLRDLLTLSKQ
jgi:hypothetical protein